MRVFRHYYQVSLKEDRLKRLEHPQFSFCKMDLADAAAMMDLFAREKFDGIIHLGAQAGVRYSLQNPQAYVDSNITGFLNVLECCRKFPVKHLAYEKIIRINLGCRVCRLCPVGSPGWFRRLPSAQCIYTWSVGFLCRNGWRYF